MILEGFLSPEKGGRGEIKRKNRQIFIFDFLISDKDYCTMDGLSQIWLNLSMDDCHFFLHLPMDDGHKKHW